MVVGLIVRVVLYAIALFFAGIGLVYSTDPAYGVPRRIGATLVVLAALGILPVTRRIILNKFGISIGGILAIIALVAALFGWGAVSPDTQDFTEISNIQTDVSDSHIETRATIKDSHPEAVDSSLVRFQNNFNITTTLSIKNGSQTIRTVNQTVKADFDYNQTKTVTVLNIQKMDADENEINIGIQNKNGTIIKQKTINKSHWSAIQDGRYSVTTNILGGGNTTYEPTNTIISNVEYNRIVATN